MSSRESSQHRQTGRPTVARQKYDALKEKTRTWYERAQDFQEKNEKLLSLNEELERENERLTNANRELTAEVKRLKSYDEEQPDPDLIDELEAENKSQRKIIRNMKKESKEIEEKYAGKLVHLERDIMLKDGKIQQLEDAKKDLKERYKDLKEDYREQQRWVRGTTSVAPGRE